MTAYPEPGVVADVVLDGGWRRHVHVLGGHTPVLVRAVDGAARLPGTLLWCPGTLEWRIGHRAARLDAVVTMVPEGFALTPIGDPHTLQRRRFVRVAAAVPTALVAEDRHLVAKTVNLSLGGMLLADAPGLRVEDPLQFALDLGGETVAGTGTVVRGAPDGSRGVRFEPLEGRAERALARFVTERQRRLAATG